MTTRASRPMQWYTGQQGFQTIADGAADNFTLYNAVSHGPRNIKGATITRMIIDLTIRADSVAQIVTGMWGILVMNADARAAGVFPDPADVTDRAGWMIRGRGETIQSDLSDASQWDRRQLDIRSQRVLRTEEDELQFIIDNISGGGRIIQYGIFIRVLVRLP